MDRVVKITSLKDKSSDFAYWSTKTDKEKLEAIELLREQYIKFKKDVQSRLQRVCTVVNKTRS